MISFSNAIKAYFLKWNDYSSRSSRSEFWWATLFVILAPVPFGYTVGFVILFAFSAWGYSKYSAMITVVLVMYTVVIYIFIASICLIIRRLHDVDESGWWFLLIFIPFGWIPLIIWNCNKGTDGNNRFGKDPLEEL